jgi:hypothetical protein
MKYNLEDVSDRPDLWKLSDPVRPYLDIAFKTASGRGVFGLKGDDGNWKAFMCYARTSDIPTNVDELKNLTDASSSIIIPYTVWSHEKGAGREIINQVLWMARNVDCNISRVITLSPLTKMARSFHTKNNAVELRINKTTVNFEYVLS